MMIINFDKFMNVYKRSWYLNLCIFIIKEIQDIT